MNRTQAHRALLKASLVLCAVLFSGICVSILNARPDNTVTVPELALDVVKRVPAAIPNLLKEKPKAVAAQTFQVWQPPCLDAHTKLDGLSTDSTWVRLATQGCDQDDAVSESTLKNQSNGFVATVFTNSGKLTSDFIPLVTGNNEMQMDVTMESGEKYHYRWFIRRTEPTIAAVTPVTGSN